MEEKNINTKYLLLNTLHNKLDFLSQNNENSFQSENKIKNEYSENNILIKYIQDPNILFQDKSYFINCINELNSFLDNNETIIFPFLDICQKLVKAYIQYDLDEEKIEEYKYMHIFEKLVKNSFISKENLFPIYSFFSGIFSDVMTLKENDTRLKKLIKIIDLWQIFYTFIKNEIDINQKEKINEYSQSSICFLGGSLTFYMREEISPEKNIIEIEIDFLKNEYFDLIQEENSFLKINNNILIRYKDIQNYIKEKVYSLTIIIESKTISINFNYSNNSKDDLKKNDNNDKIKTFSKQVKLPAIREIIFLDNFYGEVKLIKIILKKIINKNKSDFIFENVYKPFPSTNSGFLPKDIEPSTKEKDSVKKKNKYNNIFLKITNKNFTKVNYVNYGDNKFNIVDYFGGVEQLLPFIYIIQKLFINDDIKKINNESKNKICFIFLEKVSLGFFNCILYKKYNSIIIKKYFLFVYSIILEIVKTYNDHNKNDILENNKDQKEYNIREILTNGFIFKNLNKFKQNEFLINFYIKIINSFGDTSYEETIKDLVQNVLVSEKKEYPFTDADIEDFIKLFYLLPERTYSQMYLKLMKKLFIYNRMWSRKELFFNDKSNKNNSDLNAVKYKQMHYYTKSFQQPILYPILEIEKYYPEFSKFKLEKLYKNPLEKILNYDFSLSQDENGKYINNIISTYIEKNLKKLKNQEKCCLVKNTHHIKGSLSIIEMDYNGNDCFELFFFSSQTQSTDPTCNIPLNSNGSNQRNICYGSTFPCPKKDYGNIYNIKSKDIMFILIREYYHRVSAIEIFTSNNKSYFFNFNKFFINDKSKNLNQTLKTISLYFNKIKINIEKQDKKILLGYYNQDYEQYLYPLFSEDINVWEKKNICYSNYDKIIIINLLSNRSFKDIYQYPVFPMFYNHIGLKERDMNTHIGLLGINEESIKRKNLILESYNTNLDEKKYDNEDEEVCLFNTYYSNPIYICNYLLRIFPYSFLSIEFQGEGFDDPNRLFYSLPKTMQNTLANKSDYREMIPELYYMSEIFQNYNGLEFKKISTGENIDDVIFSNILNNIDNNNYENCKNLEKYKFLSDIRESLEKEKKINQWIDLIFGVDQKENENHQIYFEYQSHINYENNSELFNNSLSLQSVDFGLIPFQLFHEKFPNSYNYMQYFYQLKSENITRFENEHMVDINPRQCFVCKGRNFISPKYLEIIKDINTSSNNESIMDEEIVQNLNKSKESEKKIYEFVGDVFGMVKIFSQRIVKKEENNDKGKIYKNYILYKDKFKKIRSKRASVYTKGIKEEDLNGNNNLTILSDHHKQIKYIDYNPRLNLFLTYALDGFINIYTFPSIKLVRVLKIDIYYEKDNYLKKVILISNPFPMIFCYNENKMFVFNINGELIRSKKIEHGTEFIPCIDKDLGLIRDHIEMRRRIYQNNTALSTNLYFPMI